MSSRTISSAPSRAWRCGQLGGVAGVDEVDELHAFDDAAGVYIEAGDDALGQQRGILSSSLWSNGLEHHRALGALGGRFGRRGRSRSRSVPRKVILWCRAITLSSLWTMSIASWTACTESAPPASETRSWPMAVSRYGQPQPLPSITEGLAKRDGQRLLLAVLVEIKKTFGDGLERNQLEPAPVRRGDWLELRRPGFGSRQRHDGPDRHLRARCERILHAVV